MTDAPPSNVRVFGIGLPKTGLTSLTGLMGTLGFRNGGAGRQMRRSFFVDKDYRRIIECYDSGSFFCDGPTCLMYREAFYRYGRNARFILTVRRDSQLWVDSLKRHNLYAGAKNKTRWIFGRFYPHGFEDEFKAYYERHNKYVVQFFEDQNAADLLLVLRVDEPDAVARISKFLGVSFPIVEFPHENASSTSRRGLSNLAKKLYNQVAQAVYAFVAPHIPVRIRQPARPIDLSGGRLPNAESNQA